MDLEHLPLVYSCELQRKWDALVRDGFLEEPWWYLKTKSRTDELLQFILQSREQLWQDPYVNELKEPLLLMYVNELWITEDAITFQNSFDTVSIVDAVRENNRVAFDKEIKNVVGGNPDRLWLKLRNLWNASTDLFFKNEAQPLTVALVKSVNQKVCEGLMNNCGEWRVKYAGAAKSSVVYCPPKKINARMQTLLNFVQAKSEQCPPFDGQPHQALRHVLLLGTLFLSEFLLIHPFSNGNGRTARLLVSYFLRATTIVPFSIFLNRTKGRELYLDVLEERNKGDPPYALARYLLDCAHQTICHLRYCCLT